MTHFTDRRGLRDLAVVFVYMTALVGCGTTTNGPTSAATNSPTPTPTPTEGAAKGGGALVWHSEHLRRGPLYSSIADLAHDSTVVIEATPTGKFTLEHVGAATYTIYHVRMSMVMRGSIASPDVPIRIDGDATNPAEVDEDGVRLAMGRPYVIFLSPVDPSYPGTVGQYFIVGAIAGLYAEDGQRNLHKVDPDSPDLPALVPRSEMQRLVSAS